MIAAIERYVFNYLYKYDSVSIDIERIIDIGEDDLRNHLAKLSDTIEKEFDRILPVFEQDHEVILVEIDRNLVKIHGKVSITFKSILAVYPLTEMGRQLLSGKLNDDFKINPPKFAKIIEKIKIERSLKNRQNAAKRIFSVFEIKEFPNQDFVKEVKQVITSFLSKDNSVKKTFLYHLITYDKTPSFLPPGNAEFFAKVGLIALNSIGKEEDVFKNGPYYKACLNYKDLLNTNDPSTGLIKYLELTDPDFLSSHHKLVEIISENHKGLNIFKIAYFYLALKSYLIKNDRNLVLFYNNIIEELERDQTTTLHVLYLIAYTFSFEQLYEGLHTLDRAPLLERKFLKPKLKKEVKEELKEEVKENEKEEVKEEIKDEITEDGKKEVKMDEKNDAKEEVKEEIKEEKREDVKEELKNEKTEELKADEEEEVKADDTVEEKSAIVNNSEVVYTDGSSNAIQIAEGDVAKKVLELKQWVIGAAIGETKKTNWKKLFESTFNDEDFVTYDQFADAITKDPDHKRKLFTSKTKKSNSSFEAIDIINYFKNLVR